MVNFISWLEVLYIDIIVNVFPKFDRLHVTLCSMPLQPVLLGIR